MGNPVYQAFTATGTGSPIFLDWTQPVFNASFAVDLFGNATGTFTVQYTLGDVTAGTTFAVWHNDANVSSSTATFVGNYMFPVRAIQLVVSSLSASGTGTFSVLQGIPV